MLYADDTGVVSKSADGLARMMTVIVKVFREFALATSLVRIHSIRRQALGKIVAIPLSSESPHISELSRMSELSHISELSHPKKTGSKRFNSIIAQASESSHSSGI